MSNRPLMGLRLPRPLFCHQEEEGGGVRSGPGVATTILLFHTISARPPKQPSMVGSTLGVYSFGLIFVFARTNKSHHHLFYSFFFCLFTACLHLFFSAFFGRFF
jgi:hypothetical protein